jgi:hypothetical protein
MFHYLKILLLIIPLFFVNSACNSTANEAKAKAQQEFEQQFSKCGDSYYSIFKRSDLLSKKTEITLIKQYKNVTFRVAQEDKLDESDRLNGVEWSGTVIADYDSERSYDARDKSWGRWLPSVESKVNSFLFAIIKTKGNFKVTKGLKLQPGMESYEKPDCSSIPLE